MAHAMTSSDIELVVLAKAAQDDRAFAELVRRYQAQLRAFLLRLSGDASLVDDIAQMAFMKANSALATFETGRSFRSWLFAIGYREFLQLKRKERATKRLHDALTADGAPTTDERTATGLSLDLQSALATLEEAERAALLLCDAVGFTHAEASASLGVPLGSVKTYIARGREKMRAALTVSDEDAPPTPNPTSANGACYV